MKQSTRKMSAAVVGALLLGGAVAGCGGGDGSTTGAGSYCKDIKKADKDFGALDNGDFTKLDKAFEMFHKLADESPAAIKDDWTLLDGVITSTEKAFADAGIKFSDLGELQNGKIPAGVDTSKLAQLSTTMTALGDEKFTKASDAIVKHAKDECKVDIKGG